jgi:hypothetical protein
LKAKVSIRAHTVSVIDTVNVNVDDELFAHEDVLRPEAT